jgi:fido (protein-threonine AMPylation protein)
MISNNFFIRFSTGLMLIFLFEQADACPEYLRSLQTTHLGAWTLCQAFDNYQHLIVELKQNGVTDPSRIANWRGPRFINLPDWEKQAQLFNYNPWYIYKPAPQTWLSWENGHKFENIAVETNQNNLNNNSKMKALSLNWILDLHRISMKDFIVTSGSIRTSDEVGLQLNRADGISEQQINNINEGAGYKSLRNPNLNLLKWIPTLCWDEQDAKILQLIEERKSNKEPWFIKDEWTKLTRDPFFDDHGQKKQCGFIEYPVAESITQELESWLVKLNADLQQWPKSNIDVLETITHAQRLFIAIHPFTDGNGRISRHIMDLLIESLGLPAPVLKNMNDDLFVSETQWADMIGSGILRSLTVLLNCNQNPKIDACQRTPDFPDSYGLRSLINNPKSNYEFLTPVEVRH